jgi:hypothetical protein
MRYILMILTALIIMTNSGQAKPPGDISVNAGIFYSPLSQYGEWVNCEFGAGWRPLHVRHDWRPYLDGRWVWSDYGWYWVSDEPFGWATFHYGRWLYDSYYGWIWIPGNDWGPAWVEWCYTDDYIGWAPLSPYAAFNINIGISFSHHWRTPTHYWNFIPGRYFTTTRIIDHVQPADHNNRIRRVAHDVDGIRYEDHRIVNRGIGATEVERRTNSRVRRTDIITNDRPQGERIVTDRGRERIEAFRPQVPPGVRNGEFTPQNRNAEIQTNQSSQRGSMRDPNTIREQRSSNQRPPQAIDREQQLRTMRDRQSMIEQRTQRPPKETRVSPPERRQAPAREQPAVKERSQQQIDRGNRESRNESRGKRRL